MKSRKSLNVSNATRYYTNNEFAFVGGPYDMWRNNGNCTHYAYARSCEIAGHNVKPELMSFFPNAKLWILNSKWKTGKTPKLGAIAVYGSSTTAGHVAVVEEIYDDGSYLLSESAWQSFLFRTHRSKLKVGDYRDRVAGKLLGFIYNPYVEDTVKDEISTEQALSRMADDVIAGMYGNGKERKERLYKAIQEVVNGKEESK